MLSILYSNDNFMDDHGAFSGLALARDERTTSAPRPQELDRLVSKYDFVKQAMAWCWERFGWSSVGWFSRLLVSALRDMFSGFEALERPFLVAGWVSLWVVDQKTPQTNAPNARKCEIMKCLEVWLAASFLRRLDG